MRTSAAAVASSVVSFPAKSDVKEDWRASLSPTQRDRLDLLETFNNRFCDAEEIYRAARERCEAVRQDYPQEMIWDRDERRWWAVDEERDIDGNKVFPPNYFKDGVEYAARPRMIVDRDYILDVIDQCSKRTKRGREARRLLPIVEAHELRIQAIKDETRYDQLKLDRDDAAARLEGICIALVEAEGHAHGDLILKAFALIVPFGVSHAAGLSIGWKHGQTLARDFILSTNVPFPRVPGLQRAA